MHEKKSGEITRSPAQLLGSQNHNLISRKQFLALSKASIICSSHFQGERTYAQEQSERDLTAANKGAMSCTASGLPCTCGERLPFFTDDTGSFP